MSTYISTKDYIADKVDVLSQIGLKNKAAVESYLRNRTANCTKCRTSPLTIPPSSSILVLL